MLNHVVLQGRLTRDIELRHTQSGKAVTAFTIAVDRGRDSGADFINCVAWEKTAEFISKYFSKGKMILISGRLTQRNYQDKNDDKRTTYEVIVNNVNFCDSKAENKDLSNAYAEPEFAEIPDDDGELPF